MLKQTQIAKILKQTYFIDFTIEPVLDFKLKFKFKIIPYIQVNKLFTIKDKNFIKTLNFLQPGTPYLYYSNKRWPNIKQIDKNLHIKVRPFEELKQMLINKGLMWDFLNTNCKLYGLQDPVFYDKNKNIIGYVITLQGVLLGSPKTYQHHSID